MTQAVATRQNGAQGGANIAGMESALIEGDLSSLNPAERLAYYARVCESLSLNALTKPFDYLKLNGRLILYAKKDATDQLRNIRKVSVIISQRERIDDVYVVTARATLPDGRSDESIGAVTIGSLKGDNLANALMKAETKAKRRVTLSICGLGMLDETEIETIPASAISPTQVSATVIPQSATPSAPALPRPDAVPASDRLETGEELFWVGPDRVLAYVPKGKRYLESTEHCPLDGHKGHAWGCPFDGDPVFRYGKGADQCVMRDAKMLARTEAEIAQDAFNERLGIAAADVAPFDDEPEA